MKFRRPVSGSVSEMKKDVEPASSAYKTRATSAPNSRPASIGAKENQTQLESGATVRPTKDTSNSATGGYAKHGLQGVPKSPLVEKQAWLLPVDSQHHHHEGKAAVLR